jgi:Putative Flp pilus-assembly TadE/G-like
MKRRSERRPARGQILVLAVLALVAIVGMTGLIIDGSALFAQQRVAQNGSDGAATAGALVIAERLGSSTITRTNADVWTAVNTVANANGLAGWTAEYTTDFGVPIGVNVTNDASSVPSNARGVRAAGTRVVETTFSRALGFDQITATAEATVVAGELSGECVADENGCTLIPLTFPVKTSECDASGNLLPGTWIGAPPPGHGGEGYWPIVGAESLPGGTYPGGDTSKMAILPLCKGSGLSSGAFGWLDLEAGMNLADEITGPLNTTINLPDWFQTQTGNPNSVDDELSAYIGQTVLIPLYNQACREDPGDTDVCPNPGVDPIGNNTWYYVHTLANFYIQQVLVQASNVDACATAPGSPLVPVTTGSGFLGCLKGWFVNYITSGPITPGGTIIPGETAVGIQLIK